MNRQIRGTTRFFQLKYVVLRMLNSRFCVFTDDTFYPTFVLKRNY